MAGDGSLFDKKDGYAKLVKVQVKVDMLDNYVKRNNITSLELIKLDLEAHEDIVLSGAKNMLQNFKPIIICEVLKGKVEANIQKALLPYGYEFYHATNNGLIKQDSIKHDGIINDYFMVHPERKEMIRNLLFE